MGNILKKVTSTSSASAAESNFFRWGRILGGKSQMFDWYGCCFCLKKSRGRTEIIFLHCFDNKISHFIYHFSKEKRVIVEANQVWMPIWNTWCVLNLEKKRGAAPSWTVDLFTQQSKQRYQTLRGSSGILYFGGKSSKKTQQIKCVCLI